MQQPKFKVNQSVRFSHGDMADGRVWSVVDSRPRSGWTLILRSGDSFTSADERELVGIDGATWDGPTRWIDGDPSREGMRYDEARWQSEATVERVETLRGLYGGIVDPPVNGGSAFAFVPSILPGQSVLSWLMFVDDWSFGQELRMALQEGPWRWVDAEVRRLLLAGGLEFCWVPRTGPFDGERADRRERARKIVDMMVYRLPALEDRRASLELDVLDFKWHRATATIAEVAQGSPQAGYERLLPLKEGEGEMLHSIICSWVPADGLLDITDLLKRIRG